MYNHIKIGLNYPNIVNAIIEIPQNTHNKYEYDEHQEIIRLDRVLFSSQFYPVDYGFIPETRSLDGDHLDIMILTNSPTFPGCLVEATPIGVLIMTDDKGIDEKILAIPSKNPSYNNINDIADLETHTILEIANFFETYKKLENKVVVLDGWKSKKPALKIITQSFNRYTREIKGICKN